MGKVCTFLQNLHVYALKEIHCEWVVLNSNGVYVPLSVLLPELLIYFSIGRMGVRLKIMIHGLLLVSLGF